MTTPLRNNLIVSESSEQLSRDSKLIEFSREIVKEGAYGVVTFDEEYAYKRFDESDIHVFYREVFYLSLFKGLKISQIERCSRLQIVMKKYDGSLEDLMYRTTQMERAKIADEICSQLIPTLQEIHARGVKHRDITPANVFYNFRDNTYDFYLADFSLATVLDTNKPWNCATCMRTDPDSNAWGRETDMWMFGVMIFEFITGRKNRYFVDSALSDGEKFLDFRKIMPFRISDKLYNFLCNSLNFSGGDRVVGEITNPLKKPDEELNKNLVLKSLYRAGFKKELLFNLAAICFYDLPEKCVEYPREFCGKKFIDHLSSLYLFKN